MAYFISRDAVLDAIDEWYDMYPDSDAAREALSELKLTIKGIKPIDILRDPNGEKRRAERRKEWKRLNRERRERLERAADEAKKEREADNG